MNLLIDLVPTTIEIDKKEYEINSDFRNSILFELLMQDKSVSEEDKIIQALQLYYPVIPTNINRAVEQMLWFYRCGKDETISKGNGPSKGKSVQIYSYDYDDDYIYSAFLDQYDIDLQDIDYLHWWKFKAMFNGLKKDNKIVEIMEYRTINLSKIKDKEQKAYYEKMQKLYEIPISKNEKDKINEINNILLNGGDISKALS